MFAEHMVEEDEDYLDCVDVGEKMVSNQSECWTRATSPDRVGVALFGNSFTRVISSLIEHSLYVLNIFSFPLPFSAMLLT